MGVETMGRVTVEAKVASLKDALAARDGQLTPDAIRTVVVPDALVDSGATVLGLPLSLIQALGLGKMTTRRSRTASGVVDMTIYDPVRLTVQGRDCVAEVMALPEGMPTLIGQLPLEALDFVIDMRGHKLIGNPDHGGEHMYDLF